MDGKLIIEGLILIMVFSLAFATIYAAETGEISYDDSSKGESHLYISGSGDVSHVLDSANPVHPNGDIGNIYV